MVPDGTVWNVLQSLMVLDGERLSYRALDVEQIGSVYEAVMGFRVKFTTGNSLAVLSPKGNGAAGIVDLDRLLALKGSTARAKAIKDATDRALSGKARQVLGRATTLDDAFAALERVVSLDATPGIVPTGTPVLQPTDERRRSGSHYTPRSLTEPIVSEALGPVFGRLGRDARPEEVLDLKVLDPATGSGAFLVEACRQLSARLVEAWNRHGRPADLSPDADELLYARRLVAQRCLYGVDRNPMAIELARLSIWLVTLAGEHEFTFVDHALRHGDSLVGLTCRQIEEFHWDAGSPGVLSEFVAVRAREPLQRVSELRRVIRELGESPEHELRELLDETERQLAGIRRVADLLLSAFFEGATAKEREATRKLHAGRLLESDGASLPTVEMPIPAFHWELEFPEVFEGRHPGFDTIVGNPPFAGKNTLAAANLARYPFWLKQIHPESHGNADLVAHFFRRAFDLLRKGGTLGLIATNTIAQGDTRSTGLRWICRNGGEIYRARRRLPWPGEAAVVVSVVHLAKGMSPGPRTLDGREVERITAFLFHDGGHDDPARLKANAGKNFVGSFLHGMGFTFDDTDGKGVATPLAELRRLVEADPNNRRVIFPYIGGAEVNRSPTHAHHRYVINFRDWPLCRGDLGASWRGASAEERRALRREAIVPSDYPDSVAADWPELLAIVEDRVKPQRTALPPKNVINREARSKWWRFMMYRRGMHAAIATLDRVLALSQVSQHLALAFLPGKMVYAHTVVVFPFDTHAPYCVLQSRIHEVWARFLGSSLKDDLRYTPSDCFETFPFPEGWETHPDLESAGRACHEFRAELMVAKGAGMTAIYNRFHDPKERDPRIARLHELHARMDRVVLDAYGWTDISTTCEFRLDYEVDEEEGGRKRKPWRYRWPSDVHDEVLARLLALNATRAKAEREAERDHRRTRQRRPAS